MDYQNIIKTFQIKLFVITIVIFTLCITLPSITYAQEGYTVEPIIIYPSDKEEIPEYNQAVKQVLPEIQNFYQQKTNARFNMSNPVIVKSTKTYQILSDKNIFFNEATKIADGLKIRSSNKIALIFFPGAGGLAVAEYNIAIVGDWVLEPISGKENPWGIPCKYSNGWECKGQNPKGTIAHELGHAFGLPHPNEIVYPGTKMSIMRWPADYPVIGFLPHEIATLRNSPFFVPIDTTPSSSSTFIPSLRTTPEFSQSEAETGEIFTIFWKNFMSSTHFLRQYSMKTV